MDAVQFQLHADMEDRHWWFTGRRRILQTLVRELATADSRIVEVGCGTGGNLAEFARDFTCVGVDRSPDAIQLARRRFPHHEFHCGHAPAMLTELAPDVVLLLDVLEHIEDDRGFFEEIVDAAPRAVFLITVPADPRLWSPHDVALGHHRRYTPERFQAMWEKLPVECDFWSYFNSRLWPLTRAVRAISSRTGRTLGRRGTDLALPPGPINRLLARVFAGEARHLRDGLLRRSGGFPGNPVYRRGVSLLAVLHGVGE